jgi:glycosyltransferase involved in cell wall biosynthesis
MSGGGVERITLRLIEGFQQREIVCCLALRLSCGEFIDKACAATDVVELAPDGIRQFVPRLADLIRQFAPTHIITAAPDVTLLTLIARKRAVSDARIIQGVHLTQARAAYQPGLGGLIRRLYERSLARIAYNRIDGVVAVSKGIQRELCLELGIAPEQITLIYNPVVRDSDIGGQDEKRDRAPRHLRFCAIGRLSYQKGFDILIHAFRQVEGPWELEIYGGGSEHESLSALIAKYDLADRVFLRGHTDAPLSAIDASDWFVLPSRFEGFGLVLVEAMARGVPVIASDCPHGPREILDSGRFGIVVRPDHIDELVGVLRDTLAGRYVFDPDLLRSRARRFSVSLSVDKWVKMLTSLNGAMKDYG